MCPGYIGAQVVGAIAGAGAIIGVLGGKAVDVGLGVASYGAGVGAGQAFFAEAVGTFILAFVVFGAIHKAAPAASPGSPSAWPSSPPSSRSLRRPAHRSTRRAHFGPMLVQQIAGGTVQWGQLPIYLLAEFVGALAAGFLYGAMVAVRTTARAVAPVQAAREGVRVMKKFINAPEDVVREALAGVAAAHPELRVDFVNQIVVRADAPRSGKVGLISGGGSGHEPLHGGFVGAGMLDAACPGEVFTSPVPDQILAATKAVDGGAGVVHIVKNYTGDVLNFQMAADLAADDGVRVETVLVDDDVAVENSTWTAGRRGTGGHPHRGEGGRRGGSRGSGRSRRSPDRVDG